MTVSPPVADIVIAGAGVAGAALALALKRALGPQLQVVLADPALDGGATAARSYRALAIAPDAQRFLDDLGIWPQLVSRAQPIRSMVITDSRPGALPHPSFLTFGDVEPAVPLAHMIGIDDLRASLIAACRDAGVQFERNRIVGFSTRPGALDLTFADGERYTTRLLAAADGARSRLRHASRIQTLERRYPQSAIVATLRHEQGHDGRATQHFLPNGPIALLPLRDQEGGDRRTSIVWNEPHDEARRLAALPGRDFVAAFEDRIGYALGAIELDDEATVFPLQLMLSRELTRPRFALLGDAARTVHPLAGQGLNLGLRDAMALAQHVTAQAEVGLDPGAASVLRAYERDRRFESTVMAATTDSLHALFSNDRAPLRLLRDMGLSLVDRSSLAKRLLVERATAPGDRR